MRRLRIIRIVLAIFSFLALTATFVDFTGTAAGWFGWTARLQLWPAFLRLSLATVAALLACTLLCGRVYCSVVCPLGIFQDLLIFLRRLFGFQFPLTSDLANGRLERRLVRLGFAVAFVSGGMLGLHFQWLEPYAIYGRAASVLLAPLARYGNNALAQWAERHASYAFHTVEIVLPATAVVAATVGVVVLIAVLAVWKGRCWCNTACPVGTMLGAIAAKAVLAPRIDTEKCVKCGRCSHACKAQCIDIANGRIDLTRCVACFDCGAVCGKGAIRWCR